MSTKTYFDQIAGTENGIGQFEQRFLVFGKVLVVVGVAFHCLIKAEGASHYGDLSGVWNNREIGMVELTLYAMLSPTHINNHLQVLFIPNYS